MKKILVAGVAAAAVLGGSASAFALVNGGGAAAASATTAAAAYAAADLPCAGGALNSLVRKGTITKAQATAVQNALWAYMRDHTGRMGEHIGNIRSHMGGTDDMWARGPMAKVLQELVSKGTITKAQATAIIQQMAARHGHGAGMMGGHRTDMMGGQAGMMGGAHMGWTAAGPSSS